MKSALLLLTLSLCCAQGKKEEFSVTMDPEEKFNISWSFSDTKPTDEVEFTITCETTGWAGIGFSPKGSMKGADIIVGWVDAQGQGHLKDMHASANAVPRLDKSQDASLISASQKDGKTILIFTRKINTCDSEEDNMITTSTVRLIYAYGTTDPVDNQLSSSDYHITHRGVRSMYLLDPQTTPQTLPENINTFDVLMNKIKIPSNDTTYYCSFVNPPTFEEKQHIIAAEPIIQPGNEGLVHHTVVYGCWGLEFEHMRGSNLTEGVCFSGEMAEFRKACSATVYVWAVGGTKFYFPETAGYPLGGNDGSAPEYYMLETHYDNPQERSDFVDSSGIRFTYTPTLKPEDVGVVPIGIVNGIVAPPRPNEFEVTGYCSNDCSNKWIPEEGIQVFGYFLHAHLLGAKMRVDWYRDGQFKEVFANDDNYDFNFQENRVFPENKIVLPGDTLKITCTYTDLDKDAITFGGEKTSDEMCVLYMMYYPRQNISYCFSRPGFADKNDTTYSLLGLNRTGNALRGVKILKDVTEWTEEAVDILQSSYHERTQHSICGINNVYSTQPIAALDFPSPNITNVEEECNLEGNTDPNSGSLFAMNYLVFFVCALVSQCVLNMGL